MLNYGALRAALEYDPATGVFTRISGRYAGKVAGTAHSGGYTQIFIGGRLYLAHRLAWLWMTGSWPRDEIDHVDGNRSDNRWCNLREADSRQNKANRVVMPGSATGFKGVEARDGKYSAYIDIRGRRTRLGRFLTPEGASEAYMAKAREVYGEFARPR